MTSAAGTSDHPVGVAIKIDAALQRMLDRGELDRVRDFLNQAGCKIHIRGVTRPFLEDIIRHRTRAAEDLPDQRERWLHAAQLFGLITWDEMEAALKPK